MRPNYDWRPSLSGDLPTADTVRTDALDATEPFGPSSRPTLSDTPRALSVQEAPDIDEHAFFQAGDDGRYEGGPATMAPVAIDDAGEEEAPELVRPPDPRVLARRARGARLVALIVGAMASIFAVGLVRSSSSAKASEKLDPPVAAAPAPAPVVKHRPASRVVPPKAIAPTPEQPVAEAEPAPAPKPRVKKVVRSLPRTPPPPTPALIREETPALPAPPAGPPPVAAFPPAG